MHKGPWIYYSRVPTHVDGRRSGKRAWPYDIPCICAPVNMNLPLITGGNVFVLFAGLTLTKEPLFHYRCLIVITYTSLCKITL